LAANREESHEVALVEVGENARDRWYRQEKLFLHGDRPSGQFPGPWEQELARAAAGA
jgi:hypothetical protein